MKQAASWLRVTSDARTVQVGVFILGVGRIIQPVAQPRWKTIWVEVLKDLSEGRWFDHRDPRLQSSRRWIERLLSQVNENSGTNFALVNRCLYDHQLEIGLIGG